MTAIFISHSSADNNAALEMKAWLEQQGHTSLFLDFDPEAGIRAGGDWEETLYYKLRQCQAVVALLTPSWLASKWCFAELVQAREKGKAIFPVKVQPCDAGGVFSDIQHIDLTAKSEEGYDRLAIGLRERGLDPLDVFDWDPKRPPYPGLLAFQEEDAAIFFGRGQEILNGLETLDALRRRGRGAPRFVLFLGASGSGKSSLVRAGLIPRLKKAPSEWLPLAPFRPQDDPLDELALALADRFEDLGRPQDWGDIAQKLKAAAEQEPSDGKALLNLVRELAITAKQREATVVLTIDQAEELFGYSSADAAGRFWRLLRAALEASDRQLITVATMRSDFLGEFQAVRALHDPAYDHAFVYLAVPVDPMPERNFVEIIRGPARLAGLRLEDGLVEAMVGDTGTRDALPLLAFTLRRLYDRCGEDGRLEIREYDDLGRLEGAIRAEADRVLTEANPSPEDLEALRAAFVPTMVRINAEGGYARRRARADEVPPRARTLLRRFIDARLLISDRDQDGVETVEVAHEALLRTWPQLSTWLAEDQDKLRLLESIHRAAEEWDGGGRPADLLVHRDGRLKDAEALITNRRFSLSESSLEKRYLDACIEAQRAREAAQREEQERRIRDAERIAEEQKRSAAAQKKTVQRTRVFLGIASILFVIAAGAGSYGWWQQGIAEDRANRALRNQSLLLARMAQQETERGGATNGILLALEALPKDLNRPDRPYVVEAQLALYRAVSEHRELAVLQGHTAAVESAAFSPDGLKVLTTAWDRTARLWDATRGQQLAMLQGHADTITSAAFSPTGTKVVTTSYDGTARLWDAENGKPLEVLQGHQEGVLSAAFSPDERRVVTASQDLTARVWDAASGNQLAVMEGGHESQVDSAAFSPNGAKVVTGSWHGARVWDAASGEELAVLSDDEEGYSSAVFSPDGAKVLTVGSSTVRLWDTASGKRLVVLQGHADTITSAAISPTGTKVVTTSYDRTARLWDATSGEELAVLGHEDEVNSAAFSPDGARVVTASDDGSARLWDATSGEELAVLRHDDWVGSAAFSPDGTKVVTTSADMARLWNAAGGRGPTLLQGHTDAVNSAAFSPDGAKVVTASSDRTARLWDPASGQQLAKLQGHERGVNWAAFSPDGSEVVSASDDGTARLWDAASGRQMAVLRDSDGQVWRAAFSPDGTKVVTDTWLWDVASREQLVVLEGVNSAAFSPDGAKMVTASYDGTVRLWDAASGRERVALQGHNAQVFSAAFSPDGTKVVTASEDRTARLWDAENAKPLEVLQGHTDEIEQATFSPDGTRVVTASDDNTARLWDTATGKQVAVLEGHESSVERAAFSPDGSKVVTASDDRTARLWDATSGKQLAVLRGHKGWVRSALFSPDGSKVVTAADGDPVARVWRVFGSTQELIDYARSIVPRQLAPEQRKAFFLKPE